MTTEEKLLRESRGKPIRFKRQTPARRIEIAKKASQASHTKEPVEIKPLPALVAALAWLEKHREELAR